MDSTRHSMFSTCVSAKLVSLPFAAFQRWEEKLYIVNYFLKTKTDSCGKHIYIQFSPKEFMQGRLSIQSVIQY